MNRTNYHSHCDFCDGKASMEEYIKAAIGAGFSAYGVSSHAPLPFVMNYTMRREISGVVPGSYCPGSGV